MPKPIRILHVLGGLSIGGAESRVMDLYRNINREEVQFDFLIHKKSEQHFEKEVEKLGGKVYRVPRFKVYNWFSYKKALKQFFSNHGEFRAVHGHMTSTAALYLPIAKKSGIPITIAHARSAGVDSGIKGMVTKLLRKNLWKKTDYCLSCSGEAGVAVFGGKAVNTGRVEVIPNAICADKYVFDMEKRKKIREELVLTDKWVIGHVGSFREAKNHPFILEIFKEIVKREDAVLLLVGDGPLRKGIEEKAAEAGLAEKVIFAGNQSHVEDYYQAMDFLVFPSLYEGLPGTVVEAQTAGLRCLISDAITGEVLLTDLANAYSLEQSATEWADYIITHKEYDRTSRLYEIREQGFDIESQKKRYQNIYKVDRI